MRNSTVWKTIRQVFIPALILNILLVIPSWFRWIAITHSPFHFWYTRQIFTLFWGSVDLLLFITLMYLFRRTRFLKLIQRVSLGLYIFLLIFEFYVAMIYLIFHRPPVIASDIFLLKDAFYLLIDPSLKLWIPLIISGVLIYFIFFRLIPTCFRIISHYLQNISFSARFYRIIIAGWILVGLVQIDWGIQKRDAVLQLVSAHLGQNIVTSVKFMRSIHNTNFTALKHNFSELQSAQLSSKPDIYLIMLESYGKVMATHPDLKAEYQKQMQMFQDSLAIHGWYTATNYSNSPVIGGGSWFSSATVLSSVRIDNQPIYYKYIAENPGNLVKFLRVHSYTTFLLHPADRARPGIPIKNDFGYDHQITYDSLQYTGKPFGWGLVPDQYSLYYTYTHYLQDTPTPRFLDFTTLASHIPWRDNSIPPMEKNWRTLNQTQIEHASKSFDADLKEFLTRPYQTKNLPTLIYYDFNLFRRFILHTITRHSLIVIIGDHQPPILTSSQDGMETPVHVIADDSTLIARFMPFGFVPGMYKAPNLGNTISHQRIFPILSEVLTTPRRTTPKRTTAAR